MRSVVAVMTVDIVVLLSTIVRSQQNHIEQIARLRMSLVRWAELPVESIGPSVVRQGISGPEGALARFRFAKGVHVSTHAHESEQYTCVLEGASWRGTRGSCYGRGSAGD